MTGLWGGDPVRVLDWLWEQATDRGRWRQTVWALEVTATEAAAFTAAGAAALTAAAVRDAAVGAGSGPMDGAGRAGHAGHGWGAVLTPATITVLALLACAALGVTPARRWVGGRGLERTDLRGRMHGRSSPSRVTRAASSPGARRYSRRFGGVGGGVRPWATRATLLGRERGWRR